MHILGSVELAWPDFSMIGSSVWPRSSMIRTRRERTVVMSNGPTESPESCANAANGVRRTQGLWGHYHLQILIAGTRYTGHCLAVAVR